MERIIAESWRGQVLTDDTGKYAVGLSIKGDRDTLGMLDSYPVPGDGRDAWTQSERLLDVGNHDAMPSAVPLKPGNDRAGMFERFKVKLYIAQTCPFMTMTVPFENWQDQVLARVTSAPHPCTPCKIKLMPVFDPRALLRQLAEVFSGKKSEAVPGMGTDEALNPGVDLATEADDLTGEARRLKLEEAERAFRKALAHLTVESAPLDYAMEHYNLAIVLNSLGREADATVRERRFAESELSYREALRVHRLESMPESYGNTTYNLGILYEDRAGGAGLEAAAGCYRDALRAFVANDFPEEHQDVADALHRVEEALRII